MFKRFSLICWLCAVGLLTLTACSTTNVSPVMVTITPNAQSPYTLSGGGACVHLPAHPTPPYTNMRVSQDSAVGHSEPMLVENPRNPLNLVGGSKFFTNLAHYRFQIGYYASFDGGCTWIDGGVLPGFPRDETTSDISFAFDMHNAVYAAVLNDNPKGESGISVSKSVDGGKTFGRPVSVFDDPQGRIFSDKPWIVVDQTQGARSGTLYVFWSYDHGEDCGFGNPCFQEIAFSQSTDGGKTFSPVRQIEGNAPFCTNPARGRPAHSTRCDASIGATPVVLPDGTIAVTYLYLDLLNGTIPSRLVVTTSADGGANWSTPVLIATIHDIDGIFPPERYRNLSLPAFACDPKTGQLYIAWSDKGKQDPDILLSTSTDRGQTWSMPVRVNDDPRGGGALQIQPQLGVAPDGVVTVSFFDTRVDPRHRQIDVFLAQSVTHGKTFLPNVRVTGQTWDPAVGAPVDSNGLQFIGDYQGLAVDNAFAHPFWNDTRTGAQEIFVAAVPSALSG